MLIRLQKKKKQMQKIADNRSYPKKWDHKKVIQMWIAGMTYTQVIKEPGLEALPEATFYKIIKTSKESKSITTTRAGKIPLHIAVARDMTQIMKDEAKTHYEFFIEQIGQERDIIANRIKTTDFKDQTERMALLQTLEGLTSKVLKLNEMNITPDPHKNSVNLMVNIQQGRGPTNGFPIPSGRRTHLDQKNPVEANLEPAIDIQTRLLPCESGIVDDTHDLLDAVRAQKKG